MQYIFFLVLGVCAFLLSEGVSYAAQGTPTTPTSIVLFNNQAIVTTVEENVLPKKLPEGSDAFVLLLPASVQPSSLHVTVSGMETKSILWPDDQEVSFFDKNQNMLSPENLTMIYNGAVHGYHNVARENSFAEINAHSSDNAKNTNLWIIPQTLLPQEEKDPHRKQLLETYTLLVKEASSIQGRINAAKISIGLWEKAFTAGAPANAEGIAKVESIINNKIPAITMSLSNDSEQLIDTQRKLKNALKDIAAYDKAHHVRIAYVVVGKNAVSSAVSLHYTYIMEASNTPSYRVNAMPSSNEITIDQLANIHLQVPSTWKDVDLSLVFNSLNSSLSLEQTIPWTLDYLESERYYAAKQSSSRSAQKIMMAMADASPMESALPSQQEMSTFRMWNLGKQTLTPNEQQQIVLSSSTYKADFYYTVRPSVRSEAYLFANIHFNSPVEMPYGNATYSIDGVYAGEQNITFNGTKGIFQLGRDPQVKVQVKDIEKTHGSQGIINKEQTGTWNWEITVTNLRNRTITTQVEEPAPISLEQTIKITTSSKPEPELVTPDEDNADNALKLLVWKKELKPQESFTINHKVQATFVKDKTLSSNR